MQPCNKTVKPKGQVREFLRLPNKNVIQKFFPVIQENPFERED